jgi:diguanylate cyclase (GGDEF)-like protein
MSNAQLMLFVILGQQCLFGVVWLLAFVSGTARRPAMHWAVTAWLTAGAIALITQRGQWPAWATVALPNAVMVCSFIALRRGVRSFARQPAGDGSAWLVGACGCAGLPLALLRPDLLLPGVAMAVVAIISLLLVTGLDIRRHLSGEFGSHAATWCALPVLVLAAVFIGRGLLGLTGPDRVAAYIEQPAGNNLVALAVALLFSLLLQLSLVVMVLLRLVRRLQYRSDHDMLTGLLLRRPLEHLLRAEMQRQRRFGGSFALLAVDIDHFKAVNDRHGHAAGDAVLQRVAHAMRAAARDIDSVARMGGEEFCVLLPGADAAGAEGVAQRMLQAVRSLRHPESDASQPLQVTLSIGLAVAEAPEEPLQHLQRRLDQALYAAKSAGRDAIRHAEAPPRPAQPLVSAS